jgi:hypothetical protein
MWQDYRRSGWRGWLLPLALSATAAEQVYLLSSNPEWSRWMIPLLIFLCSLSVAVLLFARLGKCFTLKIPGTRFLLSAFAVGVIALLFAPTLWATIPVFQGTESDLPLAGPGLGNKSGQSNTATADPRLIRYLEENQGKTPVLVATDSMADAIILATNKPVMPLSGFSSYPLTTSEAVSLVKQGTIRFFLLGTQGSPTQTTISSESPSTVNTWVAQHCKVVPTSLWKTPTADNTASNITSGEGSNKANLYDCASRH